MLKRAAKRELLLLWRYRPRDGIYLGRYSAKSTGPPVLSVFYFCCFVSFRLFFYFFYYYCYSPSVVSCFALAVYSLSLSVLLLFTSALPSSRRCRVQTTRAEAKDSERNFVISGRIASKVSDKRKRRVPNNLRKPSLVLFFLCNLAMRAKRVFRSCRRFSFIWSNPITDWVIAAWRSCFSCLLLLSFDLANPFVIISHHDVFFISSFDFIMTSSSSYMEVGRDGTNGRQHFYFFVVFPFLQKAYLVTGFHYWPITHAFLSMICPF